MQSLCPRFPLAPRSRPIGTRVLAMGSACRRAWETGSQEVGIWPPSLAHGVRISPAVGPAARLCPWWGHSPRAGCAGRWG